MCAICVDYQKGLLTKDEALRNLDESIGDPKLSPEEAEHLLEVESKLENDGNK
jgi:hypothetical protein